MKNVRMSVFVIFTCMTFAITSCQQAGKNEADAEATADEETATVETTGEAGEETSAEEQLPSPRRQAEGEIDGVTIKIDYGSPAVKGRTVWGELEKYGIVWRAGANETTSIEFSGDVTVNGNALSAGKYAIFMIPNENEDWIVIINEEWDAWGHFSYKEDKDVLRIPVAPDWADEVEERLAYSITGTAVNFAWEKARISLEVKAQ